MKWKVENWINKEITNKLYNQIPQSFHNKLTGLIYVELRWWRNIFQPVRKVRVISISQYHWGYSYKVSLISQSKDGILLYPTINLRLFK